MIVLSCYAAWLPVGSCGRESVVRELIVVFTAAVTLLSVSALLLHATAVLAHIAMLMLHAACVNSSAGKGGQISVTA